MDQNSHPQPVIHKFYAGLRLDKWSKMPSVDRSELKGKLNAAC